MINQLIGAQDLIVHLREEKKEMKVNMVAHLNDCEEALENSRYMVKRSLYLHKQLNNV
jgi:hypothetical protein